MPGSIRNVNKNTQLTAHCTKTFTKTNTFKQNKININKTKLFNRDAPCNKPPNAEFFDDLLLLFLKILLDDKPLL